MSIENIRYNRHRPTGVEDVGCRIEVYKKGLQIRGSDGLQITPNTKIKDLVRIKSYASEPTDSLQLFTARSAWGATTSPLRLYPSRPTTRALVRPFALSLEKLGPRTAIVSRTARLLSPRMVRSGSVLDFGSENTAPSRLRTLRAFSVDQRLKRGVTRDVLKRKLHFRLPMNTPRGIGLMDMPIAMKRTEDRRVIFCDKISILPTVVCPDFDGGAKAVDTFADLTATPRTKAERALLHGRRRNTPLQDTARKKEIKQSNETLKEKILLQCEEVQRALINKEKVIVPKTALNRRRDLLMALAKMKKLGLTPHDFVKDDVFSKEPYQKRHSRAFFIAVKVGDFEAIKKYIKWNKFLVYDFDYVKQTALHWAARKGQTKIAEYLLNSGADVDACDIMNRTSLYFAAKKGFVEIVKVIISFQPDPFVITKNRKSPSEVATNSFIKLYLKNAKLVTVLLKWVKPKLRPALWTYWGTYIFHDPFSKPTEALEAMLQVMIAKKNNLGPL